MAPQYRLMLLPSGSLKRASTVAPVAARICGATTPAEPLAASSTTRALIEVCLASVSAILDVVVQSAAGIKITAESVILGPCQLVGAQP